MSTRVGIVVAQLGGPRDQSEVAGFIRSVFADPDTVALPGGPLVRRALAAAVSTARGPAVRRWYRAIGGGSPILPVTRNQARRLEDALRGRGHDVRASVAMRHGRPDTADAVDELLGWGASRLVLLPLYPQQCLATTGSAEHELRRVVGAIGTRVPLSFVGSWHDHPSFLAGQVGLIEEALLPMLAAPHAEPVLVFCAHGVPERLNQRGDPYVGQIRETAAAICRALPAGVRSEIGFQSRAGPVSWCGPDIRDLVRDLASSGHRALCLAPISFVSEHLETLYELDILLAGIAADAGVTELRRAPTFDDRGVFGDILADVMEDHLCTMS